LGLRGGLRRREKQVAHAQPCCGARDGAEERRAGAAWLGRGLGSGLGLGLGLGLGWGVGWGRAGAAELEVRMAEP
jgi:hypothetical protein